MMDQGKINCTAVVLTLNEEKHLADCLESLHWCEHVLVLDSFSTDRTVEIAREHGVQVVQHPFVNFATQRNTAIDLVDGDWIFFVDADERVSPELAEEVLSAIQDPAYDGWYIPRRNNFFGRWLEYGGFYPDYHLRLARKNKHRYDLKVTVHEVPVMQGKVGYLINPLIHYWYQEMKEMIATRSTYANFMAARHYAAGIRPTYQLVAAPAFFFLKHLVFLKGYKDGKAGMLLSLAWGYYAFVEYWRVWQLWKSARDKGHHAMT